jgi:hypothetical protein
MVEYKKDTKILIVIFTLIAALFFVNLFFNIRFTGLVVGLPHEHGYEGAVCWGNATFNCSDCTSDNCTAFGCEYSPGECSGVAEDACSNYNGNEMLCLRFGCSYEGEECVGELLCGNLDQETCPGIEGCSWLESSCSGQENCTQVNYGENCTLAPGCYNAEASCDDSSDNDEDEKIDCQDSDCDGYFHEEGSWYCEYNETSCDDGYDNDGDNDIDCNDTDCSLDPACIGDIPSYNTFRGRTTNFSQQPDLDNVDNLTLDNITNGFIEWNLEDINVSGADFDSNVIIGRNYVIVNSENLNQDINSSANITLVNLTFDKKPIILRDGQYCDDCVIVEHNNENITFRVNHFTNYTVSENSQLVIYDDYENSFVYNDTSINFYANYTNKTSGNHISGAVCNITFDDGTSVLMEDNGQNYNYTLQSGFSDLGTHYWNVSCNSTDYESLLGVDDIIVNPDLPDYSCSDIDVGNWNITIGGSGIDDARSLIQTYDCGFVVAANTESYGSGKNDTWIIKLNSSGNVQWNYTFGGPENDYVYHIIETNTSSLVVAGTTESYGSGNKDAWVVKLEYDGTLRWNYTFGGPEDDVLYSIDETQNFGYITAGYSKSYNGTDEDLWLIKLDTQGQHQWNKTYNGTDNDSAKDVIETSDGGFAIAGYTNTTGSSPVDYWFFKTDNEGNLLWQNSNQIVSGWPNYNDWRNSIIELSNGDFIVSGSAQNSAGSHYGGRVNPFDSSGNPTSYTSYDPNPFNDDYFSSSSLMHDDGYIFAGYSESYNGSDYDFWIIQTNSSLSQQHERFIGGTSDDYARSVIKTEDDSYLIAGYTESYGNKNDIFLFSLKTEICSNSIDDDNDGDIDCADSDCEGYNHSTGWGCSNNEKIEINCEDTSKGIGIDNDGDGFANCDDSDCTFGCTYDCIGTTNITCGDLSYDECELYGCSNSWGGPVGGPYTYQGCTGSPSCEDVTAENYCLAENNCTLEELACQNNIDDDNDTLTDCADDYCSTNDTCVGCIGDAVFTCEDLEGDNCTGFGCTSEEMCYGPSSYDGCSNITMEPFCIGDCTWDGEKCTGGEVDCDAANDMGNSEFYCDNINCVWGPVCSGDEECGYITEEEYCIAASGCSWSEIDCNDNLDNDGDGLIDEDDTDCYTPSQDPGDTGGNSGSCSSEWDCTDWGQCIGGLQYRECIDLNDCGDEGPITEKECKEDMGRMITLRCSQILQAQNFNLVEDGVGLRIFMRDYRYHIVKLRGVNEESVVIDVASRIQRRIFEKGDIELFDVDEDNTNDLEISLEKIYSPTHATISLKCLNPEPEELPKEIEEDLEVKARYVEDENLFGMAIMGKLKSDWLTWLFYLIVLAVIAYFSFKKFKN